MYGIHNVIATISHSSTVNLMLCENEGKIIYHALLLLLLPHIFFSYNSIMSENEKNKNVKCVCVAGWNNNRAHLLGYCQLTYNCNKNLPRENLLRL